VLPSGLCMGVEHDRPTICMGGIATEPFIGPQERACWGGRSTRCSRRCSTVALGAQLVRSGRREWSRNAEAHLVLQNITGNF
jgi:hypothetical protein